MATTHQIFGQAPGEKEASVPTGGEVPGDPVCNEAFGDAGGRSQGDGQVTDDCLDVERPEGIEVDLR